jgi:hypothetical protein
MPAVCGFSLYGREDDRYVVPSVDAAPGRVRIVLISEAAPDDPEDYSCARGSPLFAQTTVLAFQGAGAQVSSMQELLERGVYLTTAV